MFTTTVYVTKFVIIIFIIIMTPRERKRREQERKLGQIRTNPVMPVQPHNNGGVLPPPHHQPPTAPMANPQPYLPPQPQSQPPPSRPEKLASLPRSAVLPPASASNPAGKLFQYWTVLNCFLHFNVFIWKLELFDWNTNNSLWCKHRNGHSHQGVASTAAATDYWKARPAVHHHQ